MFYTFLLGLMLAYVYEKFGFFCAPLALHIFVNMGSVIFTETGLFLLLIRDPLVLAGAAIGGAFICSVMFVLIQRTGQKNSILNTEKVNCCKKMKKNKYYVEKIFFAL